MTELPFIDAGRLSRLLPMPDAIDALETAFGAERLPDTPKRTRVDTDAGEVLLMPAFGDRGVGVKVVTLTPGNPAHGLPFVQAVYALFSPRSQAPEAIIDGAALTALRTGAVSGLATRYLARAEASVLVIFGAGVQADSHLEAIRAVRPVERVAVVSRSPVPAAELADRARALGLSAEVADPDSVRDADVVCTCTTATEPLFDGRLLKDGAHVNAVGAYRPDARELDDETVRRGRLVVETREAALAEAGDLLIPIGAGVISEADIVADLGEVVRGAPVRRGPEDVTVFKSVGVAFEDLVVARAAVDRLRA